MRYFQLLWRKLVILLNQILMIMFQYLVQQRKNEIKQIKTETTKIHYGNQIYNFNWCPKL